MAEAATPNYAQYLLHEGIILTPSSGRNLGPLAYVGRKLAKFAMTDIMRIEPVSAADGLYLYAYLLTLTGQALIRRGRTGTTVDHLSPADVLEIPVVWFDNEYRESIATRMATAQADLDAGRLALDDLEDQLHDRLGLERAVPPGRYLAPDGARAFSVNASQTSARLDAAFYDPRVAMCRAILLDRGGVPLAERADLVMLGRYKRYYVMAGYGRPILSGRQILQLRPVNLQYISDRSFTDPEAFRLRRDGACSPAMGERKRA